MNYQRDELEKLSAFRLRQLIDEMGFGFIGYWMVSTETLVSNILSHQEKMAMQKLLTDLEKPELIGIIQDYQEFFSEVEHYLNLHSEMGEHRLALRGIMDKFIYKTNEPAKS